MTDYVLRTQADVHRLPAPRSGEAVYFDEGKPRDRAPGLALRIREAGSRKFVFFYRLGGRQLKYTIGDASSWTLEDARITARDLRVKVDKGENPADAKASRLADAALLFSSVKDDYLAFRKPEMKPRSHEECTRHLENHWRPLHRMALASIDRSVVATQLRTIAKERGIVAANRARSTLSAMFVWAIGEGLCGGRPNPVIGTNKGAEQERDRVLTDAELVKVWRATPDNYYGRIVRLLILTAQRRDEIGGLLRSEINRDAEQIELSGSRTKNGRPHDVPLSSAALVELDAVSGREDRLPVFGTGKKGYSGWSKSKEDLDEAAVLSQPWTLHDLRRTVATRMADSPADGGLGVLPHVVEAILNHVSGHKAGVAGIYNRSTYAAEKREALEKWATHLLTLVASASGANVTKLKVRRG